MFMFSHEHNFELLNLKVNKLLNDFQLSTFSFAGEVRSII